MKHILRVLGCFFISFSKTHVSSATSSGNRKVVHRRRTEPDTWIYPIPNVLKNDRAFLEPGSTLVIAHGPKQSTVPFRRQSHVCCFRSCANLLPVFKVSDRLFLTNSCFSPS